MKLKVFRIFQLLVSAAWLCYFSCDLVRQISGKANVETEDMQWLSGKLARVDTIWETSEDNRESYVSDYRLFLEGRPAYFSFSTFRFSSFNVLLIKDGLRGISLGDSIFLQIHNEEANSVDKSLSVLDLGIALPELEMHKIGLDSIAKMLS